MAILIVLHARSNRKSLAHQYAYLYKRRKFGNTQKYQLAEYGNRAQSIGRIAMGAKTQWDEKVITGMRRCGKSYLLFNLFTKALQEAGVEERQIVKINLEDRRNKGFLHSKP